MIKLSLLLMVPEALGVVLSSVASLSIYHNIVLGVLALYYLFSVLCSPNSDCLLDKDPAMYFEDKYTEYVSAAINSISKSVVDEPVYLLLKVFSNSDSKESEEGIEGKIFNLSAVAEMKGRDYEMAKKAINHVSPRLVSIWVNRSLILDLAGIKKGSAGEKNVSEFHSNVISEAMSFNSQLVAIVPKSHENNYLCQEYLGCLQSVAYNPI